MEEKRERGRRKTKTEEKQESAKFFPPFVSNMYNIKAITCCLCQRVRNNTLVTEDEMR